jgi:hypothetical protein
VITERRGFRQITLLLSASVLITLTGQPIGAAVCQKVCTQMIILDLVNKLTQISNSRSLSQRSLERKLDVRFSAQIPGLDLPPDYIFGTKAGRHVGYNSFYSAGDNSLPSGMSIPKFGFFIKITELLNDKTKYCVTRVQAIRLFAKNGWMESTIKGNDQRPVSESFGVKTDEFRKADIMAKILTYEDIGDASHPQCLFDLRISKFLDA